MVFSSVTFLGLFLPLTLLAYFVSKNRAWRNAVLLVASLFFYAWGEPVYIAAMLFVTLIDYFFGRLFADKQAKGRRALLALCVVLNLIPLFLFKYYNFFAGTLAGLLRVSLPLLSQRMPIGISFFTFQSLSYAVDVYRGGAPVQRNYLYVLLYVCMFPQLIAGPIVRYTDVAVALAERRETPGEIVAGSRRFAVGLAKKVVFANYAGAVVASLMTRHLGKLSFCGAWVAILLATFQIYFDFSGYSDMAIGLGQIFGFRFRENFNYPFCAASVSDFWRRWHISMGSWFRDYVMYPIAMSKSFSKLGARVKKRFGMPASKFTLYALSTLVTFLLIGLWHGAGWNFLLWGAYFAVLQIVEHLFAPRNAKPNKAPVLGVARTIFLCSLGFVLFSYTSFGDMGAFYGALLGFGATGFWLDLYEVSAVAEIFFLLPPLLLALTPYPARLARRLCGDGDASLWLSGAWTVALCALCFILLLGQSYNPFMYFRF